MRKIVSKLLVLSVLVFVMDSFGGCASSNMRTAARNPSANGAASYPLTLFVTPEDGHATFINAIRNAHSTVEMEMFNINDPAVFAVFSEVTTRANPVDVTLILNPSQLKTKNLASEEALVAGGNNHFHYIPASKKFALTHTKAMVVDKTTAYVTTINLTKGAPKTRDYGLMTNDPKVVNEMLEVFAADIQNATNTPQTKVTPELPPIPTDPAANPTNLIWSPVNSEAGLKSLILESLKITDPSKKYIIATVESMGSAEVEGALDYVAQNGVNVKLIAPACVENSNKFYNYQFLGMLSHAQVRMSWHPSTPAQPYMHGKMILLGNGRGYIGSVNFSDNSILKDRELGIVYTADSNIQNKLQAIFAADWKVAHASTDPQPTSCGKAADGAAAGDDSDSPQ